MQTQSTPARSVPRLSIKFHTSDCWSESVQILIKAADASLPKSATKKDLVSLLGGPVKKLRKAVANTPAEMLVQDGRLLTGIRATLFSRLSS